MLKALNPPVLGVAVGSSNARRGPAYFTAWTGPVRPSRHLEVASGATLRGLMGGCIVPAGALSETS